MMNRLLITSLLLAAACSPQSLADSVTRKAARSVVVPVLQNYMPAAGAEAATDCVMANASPSEINALARDVGVRAGTLTVQNVAAILRRPATADCLRARGLGPVAG
ncbi:MAG: hypothetical protein LBE86_13335 [Gemmobacter sp.]|nr:hypothetical protein [Gemmobacter sp.]